MNSAWIVDSEGWKDGKPEIVRRPAWGFWSFLWGFVKYVAEVEMADYNDSTSDHVRWDFRDDTIVVTGLAVGPSFPVASSTMTLPLLSKVRQRDFAPPPPVGRILLTPSPLRRWFRSLSSVR